jgi:outer membrane protein assembly factor BamB
MKNDPMMKLIPMMVFALLAHSPAGATDWNQWRGPNRDGIVTDFKPPATWTNDSLAKKWTVTVGEGHSSPVVAGDRVYVFAREGENEILHCLSLADGKVIWRESYAAPYEMNSAARSHGKGPKSTPVVAGGRVFTHGINGHVSAYDAAKGTVLWRKNFAGEFKATSPVFGASASPIVDGNNVIVHVGGDDSGALTAFDAATGKMNWKWDGDGPAYTSPIIVTLGGVRQLITQSQKHCLAVSPVNGKLIWKIPFTTPYDQNSVTPIVAGDLVIFGGVQKPMFAVKVTGTDAKQVWETNETTVYMSTPVVNGTTVFGMSTKQRGSLFAMNATTGEVLWKGEGRLGENVSITDIGSALLVVTDGGNLIVQQKSDGALKELIRYKVADSPVWAAPAVAGDQILIKDKTTLALFKVGGGG